MERRCPHRPAHRERRRPRRPPHRERRCPHRPPHRERRRPRRPPHRERRCPRRPPHRERRCPHRPPPPAGMDRVPPGPRWVGAVARSTRACLRNGRCCVGRRGRRRSMGRRSMGPTLRTSGRAIRGAPVSSPATAAGGHGPCASRPTVGRTVARSTRACLRNGRCCVGRRGRRRSMGRRSMGSTRPTSGCAIHGAPVSSPATAGGGHGPWASRPAVGRQGGAVDTSLPEERKVLRRPARTPALHGAALPTSGRAIHGAPVSSPAPAGGGHGPCASRPTVGRHGGAVDTRLPEERKVLRRPARTPALHGVGAPRGRRFLRQGAPFMERRCPHRRPPEAGMDRVPPGPRSVGAVARSTRDCLRNGRCCVGRRGHRRSMGRRSMGPTLPTSGRARFMERRCPDRPPPQAGMVRGPPGSRWVGTAARSAGAARGTEGAA